MKRGMIMSMAKKTAVVLTPGGEFVRVPRRPEYEIGQEAVIDVMSTPRARRRWIEAVAAVAALLLLFVGLWAFRAPPVVAYVTMDVNPSVELGLDSKENVRELRAVNEDAEALVSGVKYKGRKLDAVMRELAGKLVASHVLSGADGEIVIASVPLKKVEAEWEDQVTKTMRKALSDAAKGQTETEEPGLDITTVSLPSEVRDEAKANGLSSGKMAFWLAAQSQGKEVSLDTMQHQSLKKIAASWGGVNKVIDDGNDRKDDKETWKKLLDEAKEKKKDKQQGGKAEQTSVSGEPKASGKPGVSPSPSPQGSGAGKDGRGGGNGKGGSSGKDGKNLNGKPGGIIGDKDKPGDGNKRDDDRDDDGRGRGDRDVDGKDGRNHDYGNDDKSNDDKSNDDKSNDDKSDDKNNDDKSDEKKDNDKNSDDKSNDKKDDDKKDNDKKDNDKKNGDRNNGGKREDPKADGPPGGSNGKDIRVWRDVLEDFRNGWERDSRDFRTVRQ